MPRVCWDTMNKIDSKAQTNRQLRISEQIRHVLAWVFERGEVRDPGISGLIITVTEVRLSPDLRNATVFILLREDKGDSGVGDVLNILRKATPFLRKKIADSVYLRNVPKLTFVKDDSLEHAIFVNNLLQKPCVARDLSKNWDQEGIDDL